MLVLERKKRIIKEKEGLERDGTHRAARRSGKWKSEARMRSLAASTPVLLLHIAAAFFTSSGAFPIFIFFSERLPGCLRREIIRKLWCLRLGTG